MPHHLPMFDIATSDFNVSMEAISIMNLTQPLSHFMYAKNFRCADQYSLFLRIFVVSKLIVRLLSACSYICGFASPAAPNPPTLTVTPLYDTFGDLLEIQSQATKGVGSV